MPEKLTITVVAGEARAFSDAFIDVLDLLDSLAKEKYKNSAPITWNIVALQKNSPAKVVLQSNSKRKIAAALLSGLAAIQTSGKPSFGLQTTKIARRLGTRIGTEEVQNILLATGKKKFSASADLASNADDLIEKGFYELPSSVDGILEIVNVHGDPKFSVFDDVSGQEIKCKFPPEMLEDVKTNLQRRITAAGIVRFNSASDRPVSIRIEKIEPLENAGDSISLEEMPVIDVTDGSLSPEEYIRSLRNVR